MIKKYAKVNREVELMPEYLTSEEMRAIEDAAIESGAVQGITLMERAGQGVVNALLEHWPDMPERGHVVVLCGPGNNGGDGFVVARLLRAQGWRVSVFFYGEASRLSPDAGANYDRWCRLDGKAPQLLSFPEVRQEEATAFSKAVYEGAGTDIVIDALFGIGLTRPLKGLQPILQTIADQQRKEVTSGRVRYVSVDLPSGLTDAGPLDAFPGAVFQAELTVTFHRRKLAHMHGAQFCGVVNVQDIGLEHADTARQAT